MLILTTAVTVQAEPIPVRLQISQGHHQLVRGDKPYFVKGAGGEGCMLKPAEAGANSIRTWGVEGIGESLDQAQRSGLTVCAGIWLGQVCQGFDWSDAASLVEQRDIVRKTVEKYKDHPALLMWSLGNEMKDPEGRNGAVWSEIDSLASAGKR